MQLPDESYKEDEDPMRASFNRTDRINLKVDKKLGSPFRFEEMKSGGEDDLLVIPGTLGNPKNNSRNSRKLTDYDDKKHFATAEHAGSRIGKGNNKH